jgi:hypothetical protein
MKKRFNITGGCIPKKHFMVNVTSKISAILSMVEEGEYFVINRPRQYGKTTTLFMLEQELKKNSEYMVIDVSFEGIDTPSYSEQSRFIPIFLDLLKKSLLYNKENELIEFIESQGALLDFNVLSSFITRFIEKSGRNVVLLIDEVDKSSNNQLFLDFLGMLRTKYLKQNEGKDFTFHSIILAGVHDVKTLKSQIRNDDEKKSNSPWNIATDFKVDMAFSPGEIVTMLDEYSKERDIKIDSQPFAEKIFYYTSGYPFLVSKLCKLIDEDILPLTTVKEWYFDDLETAVQLFLKERNTNFDSLIKNLENNPDLYDLVFKSVMNEMDISFNQYNPVISLGVLYGVFREEGGKTKIHNRIYEQLIYNYMASNLETSGKIDLSRYDTGSSYLDESGGLNMQMVIRKFQQFMAEQYTKKDIDFIERNGRLLFLAFIRPIINGKGFDFKEVQVSEEKRLDVVVTFGNKKHIIELKIWRGESYHQAGIKQLNDYLDRQNLTTGYLVIYDTRKECGQAETWKEIDIEGKTIFAAWV